VYSAPKFLKELTGKRGYANSPYESKLGHEEMANIPSVCGL